MKHAIHQAKIEIQKEFWETLREVTKSSPVNPFSKLLQGPPRLKKFINILRKELRSAGYQVKKRDERDPEVHLLHTLCFASYVKSALLEPYRFLGEQFFKADEKQRPPVDDRTWRYLLSHPKIVWQSFVSTTFGRRLTGGKYDPKRGLENYPGSILDLEPGTRLIYTPTPTTGLEIVPEAHGFLQGMENGGLPYRGWIYINLQDLTSGDERLRSKKLMRLNELYPDTFFGITLAQDAGIYAASPEKALFDRRNFSLDSPYGYYFPAKTKEEQDLWLLRLELIAQEAEAIAKKLPSLQDHRAVFCELVNMGIIHFYRHQVKKNPLVMSASCKESIDRGGKINALLFWVHKGSEAMQDVLSCLQVRALYVRNRQIKTRRLDEARLLLQHVAHEEMVQYLTKVIS